MIGAYSLCSLSATSDPLTNESLRSERSVNWQVGSSVAFATLRPGSFSTLKLPKVDGLEVLQRLRSDEQLKMIPVVVLTSSHEEKDMMSSYKLGVNAYVV